MSKPKLSEKKVWKPWRKGGRGRPPVYQTKTAEREAVKVIRKLGLGNGALALDISEGTASKLAKKYGLTFKRGRKAA